MHDRVCLIWVPIPFRTVKKYRSRKKVEKENEFFLYREHIASPNLPMYFQLIHQVSTWNSLP